MKARRLVGRRAVLSVGLAAATVAVWSVVASAHVVMHPDAAAAGAEQMYTVSMPVEKNSDTTKLELDIPDGVKFVAVQPTAGWQSQLVKDASGNVTAIVWTGDLKPQQFMQFDFQAVNPKTPTTVAWKAYQTYADGSVVAWVGPPGADLPASTTRIEAAGSAPVTGAGGPAAAPAAAQPAPAPGAASPAPPAQGVSSSALPLGLSVLAVVLSVVALALAVRRRGV